MQATATTIIPQHLTLVVTTVYPITAMMSDFLDRIQQSRLFPRRERDFIMKRKLVPSSTSEPVTPETKPLKLPLASDDMTLMRGTT